MKRFQSISNKKYVFLYIREIQKKIMLVNFLVFVV